MANRNGKQENTGAAKGDVSADINGHDLCNNEGNDLCINGHDLCTKLQQQVWIFKELMHA